MPKKSDILLSRIRDHGSFSGGEMLNLIILLSVPSVLAQITSTLIFYIDASMVGSLGAEASAAVGIVETTTWLFGSLTSALAMGFSVQVAHRIGANDQLGARGVFRQSIVAAVVCSVLIAIVGVAISPFLPYWLGAGEDIAGMASWYFGIFISCIPFYQIHNLSCAMLKCSGNMVVPSVMSVLMCVFDALFNCLFIFVLKMGVPGAAMGTAIAIAVSCMVTSYFAMYRSKTIGLFYEDGRWKPTREVISKALSISLPMGAQYTMMNVAQIVQTLIVAPLGTVAIAAHSLAITAESLCYMPGHGVGEAATTLVGQSLGAGEMGFCRSFAKRAVALGMIVMALMGFIMYVFAPEMIGLMSPVEAIRELGTDVLRIEAWAEPMFAAAIVSYACFVGAGDTLKPAMINLGTMWFVRLTIAAALAPTYGLQGVWIGMAIELSFRGLLMMVRLFKGHWMKMSIKKS